MEQCIPPPRHVLLVSQSGTGFGSVIRIVTKINRLFTGPLPTLRKNFVQIRSEVFAQSC